MFVCVFSFNFVFNLVWPAVNGAWLVLGINDMTRDTPLLEFSQVRATPIDGTPPPLCLPSCWMKASLFFPLFLLFFQLIKERDGHKRAYWGDMKMGEGERGSPVQMWRSSTSCLFVWNHEEAESEQPALAGSLRRRTYGAESLQHTLAIARSIGRSVLSAKPIGLWRGGLP